jgi:hypothetical protein
MHTIKLHIEDKVFDKVIYFLKNLPKNEVLIEEDDVKEYSLAEFKIDDKKRIGHSFPSIHTSLAISIALTVIARGPNMGLLLSALAITITCTRLLTGVHYLTDILASILIALAIYMI